MSAASPDRPGFLEGVGVAAVLALAGGALFALLAVAFGQSASASLTVTAVGAAYLGYLCARSSEPTGRVTLALIWAAVSMPVLVLVPALSAAAQPALLWLARVVLLRRGPIGAGAEASLVLIGLGGAIWALTATGSVAAALWTFFLVQALFPAIDGMAAAGRGVRSRPGSEDDTGARFRRAQRSAVSSLERLARNF
jgi:hypothetical protein